MGGYSLWIEIGQPSPDKLHKITKQAARVCVYTHKSPDPLLAALAAGTIHRGDEVLIVAFSPTFIDELAARLTRKNTWGILRSDGTLYVTVDDTTLETLPTAMTA